MNTNKLDLLLEKYLEGETSLEEEAELRRYFERNQQLPPKYRGYAYMFRYFEDSYDEEELLTEAPSSETVLERIDFDEEKPHTRLHWLGPWQAAAAVAILVIGFGGGLLFSQLQSQSTTREVAALRDDVKQMKRMLMNDDDTYTSASERIQIVKKSYRVDQAGEEMLDALINTMYSDPDVNVQLAAAEALYRFRSRPQVHAAMLRMLERTNPPALTVAVIEILVQMNEKRAVDPMKRLLMNDDLNPTVRHKLQEAINHLS